MLYFAVRPPLFDRDGYEDRLDAFGTDAFYAVALHHLLLNFSQIAIARVAAWLGHPTTFPFQLVGILANCTALLLFFTLLRKVGSSAVFASIAVAFVAASPEFWYLGFQNRPYPLMFVALILYKNG